MVVLWLMHIASFFINRSSFSRKFEKEEDNDSNYQNAKKQPRTNDRSE
jgi:hypothetical protein